MATGQSDEYSEFVAGLVPLGEAQPQSDQGGRSPFEALVGRFAGSRGGGFRFSFLSGAGLLLVAAALAVALPSENLARGSFWRLGGGLVAEILSIGNGLAPPLALGALALSVLAVVAAVTGGQVALVLLTAQPFIGGAGLVGVGLIWVAFLALAIANFAILLLIIIAYVVATIILFALVIGFLIGLVSQ